MKNIWKVSFLMGAPFLATSLAAPSAIAQMYSNGPGFYMSLEGRYLQNAGDKTQIAPQPSITNDTDKSPVRLRNDKDLGGKAGAGYRFDNNWDIGVSAGGMKSLR